MASEQVLDIPVRRHVLTSERPFQDVLDSISEPGPVNLLVLKCHVVLLDGAIASASPPVR